jgi:alkyl sulfatase BDS1-like metallo-beta-lactamase superfamily hydrolase
LSERSKPATPATARENRDAVMLYAMDDRHDFDATERGFLAALPGPVRNKDGVVVFDPANYDIVGDGDAPDTVNPSLWRQSQVIKKGGLFKVVDGLYQVRNNDTGNLTIVDGPDGLVVIDCQTSVEAAAQGLSLFREHVSDKAVVAVIYTHTHIDHYGGVKGLVEPGDVTSGKVPIIAPGTIASFDKYAIGENVIAGNAMSRRAGYAFGNLLEFSPRQFVGCGIAVGGVVGPMTVSYLSPTDSITETGQKRELAGVEFEFLYAPDTEAPEEMHIWIPELGALTCAENANHSLHNIQTLRGARTRDARNFARYLDETLERWGDEVQVHYGPHTWPVWGNDEVTAFLSSQRDTYKYIHDQSLRLANHGLTPIEAAEVIELPEQLGRMWFNRGYHGTLHHDVRAVYTKELGMWDGDPVSLHPHPPVESAKRFVAAFGADAILAEGRRAFDAADYRWAAQVLHTLVFADPNNSAAKNLQADAYEQMGYQSEGPQWRYIFLTAAKELRDGVVPAAFSTASPDTILAMPVDILFDFAAVHLDGPNAARVNLTMNLVFTDLDVTWHLWVRNGVLNARRGRHERAHATLSASKPVLVAALLQPGAAAKLAAAGQLSVDGDTSVLETYTGLLDQFDPNFDIVTP